jgi:anthranilate/para-aminobenzoate synthase component I
VTDYNLFTILPINGELIKFTAPQSARLYYKNYYVDLLSGKSHAVPITNWINGLSFLVNDCKIEKRITHLFYELGFIFESMSEEILNDDLMAIDIHYLESEKYKITETKKDIHLTLLEAPDYDDYKNKFNEGYSHLLMGNCYQFNLTGKYHYSFNENCIAEDFIHTLWRKPELRGAYGSATYSQFLNKLFLSNSPECLFQFSKGLLTTRPVKGTMKRPDENDNLDHISSLWKKLKADKKSESELYMITDLLRNDLCRIDLPVAVVTKKKAMLLVPGLIHQYSEIQVNLRKHITMKNILEKIFPGGSITGAPKKRVMKLLKKIENRGRGFYCGTTIFYSKNSIEASINIRSSVVDFADGTLLYQAGGGITLRSDVKLEFDEMTYKHNSYIDILTP